MSPSRIQLSRKKGWRKPEGAVVVARPSMWGNPFSVRGLREIGFRGSDAGLSVIVVNAFTDWLQGSDRECFGAAYQDQRARILLRLHELRGRDLACWCPPGCPCHADVLLELANAPLRSVGGADA